ncbi:MAG: serine/threonine protein kinase, partial [Deltaproteobacteria bacterium]|nr:serine/threonine protein kinase [Deltaproteobacteria bacterium]
SPQNVLVSRDGEVKVTDFGIAKAADRARRTRTGMLMGKVRYMAPEQARAEDIDARADVFSAAAVLFEAITGRHLIEGRAPEEILLNIVNGRFPRLSEVAQGIPVGLDAIMDRATEQDRSLRYTDGGALARDLERLLHVIAPAFSRDDLASLVQSLVPKSPPQNHEPTRPVLTEDALAAYPTIPEGDVSQVADIPPGIDAINLPAARTRSLASVGGADLAYGHTDLAYGPTLPPSDVPGDNPNNDDPYAAALRAELGASVNDDRPSAAAGSISIPATGKGPYPTATREGASDDRDMSLSAVVARAQQSQEPPGPDHPDVEFLLNPRPPTLIHDRRRERRSPEALGTAPPRRRRLLAAAAVALLLGPAAGFVASRVYRNARPQNANLTHLPEVALPQGKPIALAPTWTLAIQGAKRPHNSQGHAHQIIDVALRHAKAATPPRLGSVFALLDAQGLHPALFWYPRKDGSLRLVFPLPVGHGPLRLRLRATAPGGARAFSVIP